MESTLSGGAALSRLLRILPFALLALLLFPDPARALGDHIGFEAAPWMQGLDGRAEIDGDASAGTEIDFTDTLGLDRGDTSPTGRLWFRLAKTSLILDVADSTRSGSEVLTQSFTFNDTTYSASETVSSDFDLRLLQGKLRYSIIDAKVAELAFDFGANVAKVDMQVQGSSSGMTTFNENVPFPTVGAALILKPLPGFHIRAEADGLSVTVSGNTVRILDARLQIEKYFLHSLGIFGGYRSYRFDVDSEDFGSVETTFKGAYAGLAFKF